LEALKNIFVLVYNNCLANQPAVFFIITSLSFDLFSIPTVLSLIPMPAATSQNPSAPWNK
jgi:hypothetical protein